MGLKADSHNAVLTGTTTVYGPALLNGPVTFGSSITGIDISDVKDNLQTALDTKAIQSTTYTKNEGKSFIEREGKPIDHLHEEANDKIIEAKANQYHLHKRRRQMIY